MHEDGRRDKARDSHLLVSNDIQSTPPKHPELRPICPRSSWCPRHAFFLEPRIMLPHLELLLYSFVLLGTPSSLVLTVCLALHVPQ